MNNKDELKKEKQKIQDELTDIDLKLAALDGDEAAGATIAMQAATAKLDEAQNEFNQEIADIEAGVKKIFEEESANLDKAQMEDAQNTIANS